VSSSEGGQRRTRLVAAFATAAVVGLAVPVSARAGPPAVTLDVTLEYAAAGSVSSAAWTPLQVAYRCG
jgi:hypothetical protein